MGAHPCHLSAGEVGTGAALELTSQAASLLGDLQVSKESCLKIKEDDLWTGTTGCP